MSWPLTVKVLVARLLNNTVRLLTSRLDMLTARHPYTSNGIDSKSMKCLSNALLDLDWASGQHQTEKPPSYSHEVKCLNDFTNGNREDHLRGRVMVFVFSTQLSSDNQVQDSP